MDLGAFSISLAVKDLLTSRAFYEGLGFTDVREIAARLEEDGVEISTKELPGEGGPGHIALTDPDGNQILIDQHR